MPIVGTATVSVTIRATPSGTASSTIAKQPASASATASSTSLPRGVELLALHLEAAERVDGLRREADVAHHRDLGVEDRPDRFDAFAPAFELHRAGAGPDQCGRVADGLAPGDVVAEPREVAHDQRPRSRTGDRGDVVGHVLGRDLQRVVVSEHDHREGVADEDHVGAGSVDDTRRRRVVRRDHHERLAAPLAGTKLRAR